MFGHFLIMMSLKNPGKKAVVASTVSSGLLKAIAEKNGVRF